MKVYLVQGRHFRDIKETTELLNAKGVVRADRIEDADVVLVLGDDRDLLDALQTLGDHDVPILGVGVWGTSFLASTTLDELSDALDAIERGEYELAEYTKLKGIVNGKFSLYALNEIAVFPSKSASLMSYKLYVDDDLVWTDRADGVLVATPIGSTAYALSAGGAVVFEGAEVFEIVPVNSVDPSKRPIIVPSSSVVTISEVASKHPCEAIADGGKRVRIGREIVISKAGKAVKIIRVASRPSVKESMKAKVTPVNAADMPPSAKFVLKILELKGPLTVKELAKETMLPERTVRYALSELLRRELVKRVISLRDARLVYYRATTLDADEGGVKLLAGRKS